MPLLAPNGSWLQPPQRFPSRNPAMLAIVAQVQDVVLIALRILVRAPLLFVGSLIMAVATSPQLALILLILDPFVIGLLVWAVRRSRPLYAELQRRLDRLNTVIQENLAQVKEKRVQRTHPKE